MRARAWAASLVSTTCFVFLVRQRELGHDALVSQTLDGDVKGRPLIWGSLTGQDAGQIGRVAVSLARATCQMGHGLDK